VKLTDIKKKLAETENTVNAKLGELQTNEKKILSLRSQYEWNAHEIQKLGKDVELQQEVLDTKVKISIYDFFDIFEFCPYMHNNLRGLGNFV
jgi:predicted  nucleic acid-binding Zn-ribbon protein